MSTDFRESAQARIRELDRQDLERRTRLEQRRQAAAAGQTADAARRERAQAARWERLNAEARDRIAARFGAAAAGRVALDREYRVFVAGRVAVAVARGDEPTSAHGRHLTANHSPAWKVQARLQDLLGRNPGLAQLVQGRRLAAIDPNAVQLLVDPSDRELQEYR